MGVQNSCWAREQSRAQGAAKAVLLALASAADDTSKACRVSCTTLARWAGVDARTVKRAIAYLEALGELLPRRSAGRTSEYVLLMGAEPAIRDRGRSVTTIGRNVTGDNVSPVTHDPGTGDIVTKTGDTTPPIKVIKDLKGEKPIVNDSALTFSAQTQKQKAPTPAPAHRNGDSAIKRQSNTWVEPAAADAGKIWVEICAELRLNLTPAVCDQYLRNVTVGGLTHGVLTLVAPEEQQAHMLNTRLAPIVARAARLISGDVAAVRCDSLQRKADPDYRSLAELLSV